MAYMSFVVGTVDLREFSDTFLCFLIRKVERLGFVMTVYYAWQRDRGRFGDRIGKVSFEVGFKEDFASHKPRILGKSYWV